MITTKEILAHPLLVTFIFCSIIISGEQMGGFYILYILLGLPHLVLHSVLAILGITITTFSVFYKRIKKSVIAIAGSFCMIASLLFFFLQPNGCYNYNTFHEVLPLISLVVFAVILIAFITLNARTSMPKK